MPYDYFRRLLSTPAVHSSFVCNYCLRELAVTTMHVADDRLPWAMPTRCPACESADDTVEIAAGKP